VPDASFPPDLPGRRALPPFAPSETALEDALLRGRRRRAVTGTAAGTALLLVPALLYATLGTGTQRSDSLVANQPPAVPTAGGQQDPTPDPQPTVGPALPAAQPGQGAAAGGSDPAARPTPVTVPGLPQAPGSTAPPAPRQTATAGGQPARPARSFPVVRDTVAYTADSCQHSPGTGAAAGWCIGSPGAFSTRQGQPVKLRQLLCRVPASGSREAKFPRVREVEFHIYDGRSTTRWKNTRDLRRSEHSIMIEENTCVRWTVTWDALDDAGEIVPPGNYALENTIDADLSGIGQSGEGYAFPYDFDVTE
jgi:hypothetical protein